MTETKKDTAPARPVSPSLSPRERLLDLIALLSLLALCTVVFLATGAAALATVTGVAVGLFATWRGRRGVE